MVVGCKYLPGNNFPRIRLMCGKLFPDRYFLLSLNDFVGIACSHLCWLSLDSLDNCCVHHTSTVTIFR